MVLVRGLGLFENWAATFTTMNFVSGMPILLGFALATGEPQAALSNWTMEGGHSLVVSFALAEIATVFPTAGGIYYWSYRLGGTKWAPFLSWLTASISSLRPCRSSTRMQAFSPRGGSCLYARPLDCWCYEHRLCRLDACLGGAALAHT